MDKRELHSSDAPSPAGPYSQGIQVSAGVLCFTAGQIGADPRTGELAPGVGGQTRQALENVRAILAEAGAGVGDIVKTTAHLQDFGDFALFNEAYAKFFDEHAPNSPRPARTTVQSELGGVLVEIDATAVK